MKTYSRIIAYVIAAVLLASCATPGTMGYLRDMKYDVDYQANKAPALKLQSEDVIDIKVMSSDPELAAPFNSWTGTGGGELLTTYTVDNKGEIDFPVLGVLPVEGKTLDELKDEIAAKISSMGYIKEPIVMAKLENFKVSVIGEVNRILTADGESMNLVQAVAQMAIPRESGKINDLMVIRTQDGIRRAYQVNLQSKDLFDSPVYYLQQNDIIYVKPKGLRFSQTGSTIRDFMGSVFSFATSIFYMTYWLAR